MNMEYGFVNLDNNTIEEIVVFPNQFKGSDYPNLIGIEYGNPPMIFTEDTIGSIELFEENALNIKGWFRTERNDIKYYEKYGDPYLDIDNQIIKFHIEYLYTIEEIRNIRISELDYLIYNILYPKTDRYGGDWLEIKKLRLDELDDNEIVQMNNRAELRNSAKNVRDQLIASSDITYIAEYQFNF